MSGGKGNVEARGREAEVSGTVHSSGRESEGGVAHTCSSGNNQGRQGLQGIFSGKAPKTVEGQKELER